MAILGSAGRFTAYHWRHGSNEPSPMIPALSILKANWKWIAIAAFALWIWRLDDLRETYKAKWHDTEQEYATFRKEMTDRTAQALAKEKALAKAADKEYTHALDDARDDTDRYIAAHSVRQERVCSSPSAAAPNPGVPQELPADTFVAVSGSDVRACSEAVIYAVSAHNWSVNQE